MTNSVDCAPKTGHKKLRESNKKTGFALAANSKPLLFGLLFNLWTQVGVCAGVVRPVHMTTAATRRRCQLVCACEKASDQSPHTPLLLCILRLRNCSAFEFVAELLQKSMTYLKKDPSQFLPKMLNMANGNLGLRFTVLIVAFLR